MAGKVTIHNRLQNAIEIRLHEMSDDNGQVGFSVNVTGVKTARRVGDAVALKPGDNAVDADFWRSWAEQNANTGLRTLFEEREEETA